jgi:uncharacterized protein (TIGR03435 family)
VKKLTVCVLIAIALSAQSEKKKLTFEVVSIKLNKSGDPPLIQMMPGGRFTASSASLKWLIAAAYDPNPSPLSNLDVAGLPGWANRDGYDVQAKSADGFNTSREQMQEMLQSMLEDRFKLKIRRQPKEIQIYALVAEKGGVKMKLSEATPPGKISFRLGRLSASAQTTSALALVLSGVAGRKVADKTGLSGFYDWDLKWTPDQGVNGAALPPGTEFDPTGPALFTALQEQLGLRLVSDTGQVDSFIVESVERPSEN